MSTTTVPDLEIAEQTNLTELSAPAPDRHEQPPPRQVPTTSATNGRSYDNLEYEEETNLTELKAPAPVHPEEPAGDPQHQDYLESAEQFCDSAQLVATQLQRQEYLRQTVIASWLGLFAILGTLTRLGMEWLFAFPDSPLSFPNIWANVTGCYVMGFLTEDKRLFHEETWSGPLPARDASHSPSQVSMLHNAQQPRIRQPSKEIKATVPLYIGLTVGFCGSLTSFSAFERDIFLETFNVMVPPGAEATLQRSGGYSILAFMETITTTMMLCMVSFKFGAHSAIFVNPAMPTLLPKLVGRLLDPLALFLGVGCWVGAIIMTVLPPDRPGGTIAVPSGWAEEHWRGEVLFALVFAPLGCFTRFWLSLWLNKLNHAFPLGTFSANIFGTMLLALCYVLQRRPLAIAAGQIGGGHLTCQVLQGIQDGYCGTLTTMSTLVLECSSLRRAHAYKYGATSVIVCFCMVIVIMGSARWSKGFEQVVCTIGR